MKVPPMLFIKFLISLFMKLRTRGSKFHFYMVLSRKALDYKTYRLPYTHTELEHTNVIANYQQL